MAEITTTQAGDWDAGTTWTGGSKPTAGTDTAVINHAVTVDTAEAVGTDPTDTTTLALTINADLTVVTGGTLTIRGNVQQTSAHFIGTGTGIVEVGSTTASSQNYLWKFGDSHGDFNEFRTTGTSTASPFVVRKVAGGANWSFEDAFQGGSNMVCQYTTFTDIGTSGTHAFDPYLASGDRCHLRDCVFTDCGEIQFTPGANANSEIRVENCNFTGGTGTYDLNFSQAGTPLTGAFRTITDNYFGGELRMLAPDDYTVTGNVINDVTMTEASDHTGNTWQDNLVIIPAQPFTNLYANIVDDYWLLNYTTTNPHGITHASPNSGKTYSINGVIFEYIGTSTDGDMIGAASTPAGAWNLDVTNCIVLPNPDGGNQPGTLVSCLGNADLTLTVEHNTFVATAANSGMVLGESYAGHADMCDSFRSNLGWHGTGTSGLLVDSPSATVGMITEANCDYNGTWNLAAGSEGQGYDLDLVGTAGTDYATNDVLDTDPNFVDSTRNMAAWDSSLGGAGTRANALTELAKMNLSTWDANYTPAALHAYVKAGFAPQEAAYDGAAHDSGTIGAVAFSAPASTGYTRRLRNVNQAVQRAATW